MRLILALALLACNCLALPTFLISTQAGITAGGQANAPAINTTGGTLAIMFVSNLVGSSCGVTVGDNLGNVFTCIADVSSVNNHGALWYVCSPAVSTSHIFKAQGNYVRMFVLVFSGSAASMCYDGNHSEFGTSGSTVQAGSITAGQNDSIYVAGVGGAWGNFTLMLSAGFTLQEKSDTATGEQEGGIAYKIVSGAPSAQNPTWDITPATDALAATIATFKPTGGGGTGSHTAARGFTF